MESIKDVKMASIAVSPWARDGGSTKLDVFPSGGGCTGMWYSGLSELAGDMFSREVKSISSKTEMERGYRGWQSLEDRGWNILTSVRRRQGFHGSWQGRE